MKTAFLLLTFLSFQLCLSGRADEKAISLEPKQYSELHLLALNPDDPHWQDAMRKLETTGDAISLACLKRLNESGLTSSKKELLKQTMEAIGNRVAKEDLRTFTALIQVRLERAA